MRSEPNSNSVNTIHIVYQKNNSVNELFNKSVQEKVPSDHQESYAAVIREYPNNKIVSTEKSSIIQEIGIMLI